MSYSTPELERPGIHQKQQTSDPIQMVITSLASDLTTDNPAQQRGVEQALFAMLEATQEIKALAVSEPPTIVIELDGGIVQEVHGPKDLPLPIRVLVRDRDIHSDPELIESEWLLGERNDHEN